jgi:hypothetical protein
MDVLVPKDFDIASIEKCMMDYDCNFVSYEDEDAIDSRLGSDFIVLQEKYFIAHVAGRQVKCDYDCRNFIMRRLYPGQGSDKVLIYNDNFFVEKIDGVVHNRQPPYLLFTNECIRGFNAEDNTIIANYTNVDIPKFAETTKSKECNHMFYVVYLGDDQYICCDVRTLKTYEYSSVIKHRIMSILREKSNDPFAQLQAEYEELKSIKTLPRVSNFHLRDIEGRSLETNTDYRLELYDNDQDILYLYKDKLSATYYLNAKKVDKVVVQYSVIDGIHYLTCKNKYMYAADNGIQFTDQRPRKNQRLQFQVTENNSFIMVQWNQRNCLELEVITCSYTMIYFSKHSSRNEDVSHLQFFLKKVET